MLIIEQSEVMEMLKGTIPVNPFKTPLVISSGLSECPMMHPLKSKQHDGKESICKICTMSSLDELESFWVCYTCNYSICDPCRVELN
jgi:hypothetical protein